MRAHDDNRNAPGTGGLHNSAVTNRGEPPSSGAGKREGMPTETRQGKVRKLFRRLIRWGGVVAILVALALLFWLRGALYDRFVRFPRQEAAWTALRAQRQPVTENAGWREFRGILHSHSKLSHDCEVPFEEILRVLKATGIDFICLSDHCTAGRADFHAQWRGLHEGKLFIPLRIAEGIPMPI